MAVGETTERLSTGIEPLDRELGGGVFPGSIISLVAPPASQSEPILHEAMRQRRSIYVTTRRNEATVENDLSRSLSDRVDYDLVYTGLGSPIEAVTQQINRLGEGENLIIDTVDPLEEADDSTHYVEFLNDLKTRLLATGSIALLHCEASEHPSKNRELTQSFADIVWDLSVEVQGTDLENRLAIPKFRGADIVDETIKLKLGKDVAVDTSRDIA